MKIALRDPWIAAKEAEMFFQKRDRVHRALKRLVGRMEEAGIDYAVVGGLALNAHGYERVTKDIDVLMNSESFDRFRQELGTGPYLQVAGRRRRFVEKRSKVIVDVLVAGLFPGDGRPKPLAFPDPRGVSTNIKGQRVVNLNTLVELKLAARRWKDFADVIELIRANHLDEAFGRKLHPYVRQDYVECLEEFRREEEYEKRQDSQP